MKRITKIFWNENERRVRSLWRLLLQVVIFFLVLLIFQYVILLVTAFVGLITQTITVDEVGIKLLKKTFRTFSENHHNLPILVHEFLSVMVGIWLAGRLLDRRRFPDFGFRFNKKWWGDFGFGLFLGGFLITLVFLIEWAAGWIKITGVLVSSNPENAFALMILYPLTTMIMVGIQEELTSRGYVLTNLAEGLNWKRIGPRGAILGAVLLSAINFARLHLNNPHTSAASTLSAFMGGMLLALGFILTGELAIPIGLHITWNFFQANVFGFTLSGGDYSWATIFATEQSGPAIWVGDAFGPESGLLAISAVFLGCLLITLWVRLRYGRVGLHTAIAMPPENE